MARGADTGFLNRKNIASGVTLHVFVNFQNTRVSLVLQMLFFEVWSQHIVAISSVHEQY